MYNHVELGKWWQMAFNWGLFHVEKQVLDLMTWHDLTNQTYPNMLKKAKWFISP